MSRIYATGTAAVDNGGTTVTITGGVLTALNCPADADVVIEGVSNFVASRTSTTTFELATPHEGSGGTGLAYAIRRITAEETSVVTLNSRLAEVISQIDELGDTGIAYNAFGTFAGRSAHDDKAEGFVYLSLNGDGSTGVWTLYIKQTAASADWDGGQEVEGPKGDTVTWLTGSGVPGGGVGSNGDMYLDTATSNVYGPKAAGAWGSAIANIKGAQGSLGNLRGAWATATAYAVNDVVSQGGSSYVARTAHTSGTFATDLAANKWQLLVSASGGREILTANRTYYVRTDGSNSNNGLSNTAGGAFLTLQKAWDTIASLDLSIYTVTIQVADGTYTAGINATTMPVGGAGIVIQGNTPTPSNVHINGADHNFRFRAALPCPMTIKGFKCTFAGASKCAVLLAAAGWITLTNMNYAGGSTGFAGAIRAAAPGAYINVSTAQEVSGNMSCFVQAANGGVVEFFGITVTLTGTPAWSWVGMIANNMGLITMPGVTFSGAATGKRYEASTGGGINSNGGGASYLPGSSAGSITTPGWYV